MTEMCRDRKDRGTDYKGQLRCSTETDRLDGKFAHIERYDKDGKVSVVKVAGSGCSL